jgi:hypothetical protein
VIASAVHLGDADPRLRRRRFHGLSTEAKASFDASPIGDIRFSCWEPPLERFFVERRLPVSIDFVAQVEN